MRRLAALLLLLAPAACASGPSAQESAFLNQAVAGHGQQVMMDVSAIVQGMYRAHSAGRVLTGRP